MFIISKYFHFFNNFTKSINNYFFVFLILTLNNLNLNSEPNELKLSYYIEEDYPNKILDLFIGEWKLVDTMKIKLNQYKKIETFCETWHKVSDKEIQGFGYKLEKYYNKAEDTTFKESMKIFVDGSNLILSTKTDNNKDTIHFTCNLIKYIRKDNYSWIQLDFLNLKHDFPNLISYSLDGKNLLDATVSGDKKEKEDFRFDKTIRLKYNRIK